MALAPASEIDVFILYNERESKVREIVDALERRGIKTHFWQRDVPLGEEIAVDRGRFDGAQTIVIMLGEVGWGPTHVRLAVEAREKQKRILPVLIGRPPEGALEDAGGIFVQLRRLELIQITEAALDALAAAIRGQDGDSNTFVRAMINGDGEQRGQDGDDHDLDNIMRAMIGGDGEQRANMLLRVQRLTRGESVQLGDVLRHELRRGSYDAAARSWLISCLIWADPYEDESKGLIIRHLEPSSEPDDKVRFWTLAALFQSGVTMTNEIQAIARGDPDLAVRSLAEAIGNRAEHLPRFREMLSQGRPETTRPILRMLRIVPMPELAEQVAQLVVNRKVSYDAFYALSNASMLRVAAPILISRPGSKEIVARMLDDLSAPIAPPGTLVTAARVFAAVLAALDAVVVRKELEQAGNNPAALRLLASMRERPLFIAGFASEAIDVANDMLDIREDVETLAAVMIAKDVTPPLAIGLFGDWGTGKSFFMHSMRAATKRLNDQDLAGTRFCKSVVSIEFNAWHFVDTNLWASLVTHILERLDAFVTPRKDATTQHQELKADLVKETSLFKEADEEKKRAQGIINERTTQLQKLQRDREQKELELSEIRLTDLHALLELEQNKDLKKKLDDALTRIGVPNVTKNVAELSEVLKEAESVRGRLFAIMSTLFKSPLFFALVAFLVVGLPLLDMLIDSLRTQPFFQGLLDDATVMLSKIGAVLAGAGTILRVALTRVNEHLTRLEGAKQEVDKLVAAKRKDPTDEEKELEKNIETLKAQETGAAARLTAAATRVAELEDRMKALEEGRSLARFLAERSRSNDYSKHLGLISTIRQDFDALTARMAITNEQGERLVDRIVLYIDDLDRCPTDKVMDILQAVHLLLAYPLFVVVVGVDPRWLVRSLNKQHAVFSKDDDDDETDLWITTPQNYLEKIFQVTFSLRSMNQDGYAQLMGHLFSTKKQVVTLDPAKKAGAPQVPGAAVKIEAQAHESQPHEPQSNQPQQLEEAQQIQEPKRPERAIIVHEEALEIKEQETTFARVLFPLIPTPRAAKRFANMYRILKARVQRHQLPDYEGKHHYQVPMLLLAILIGAPADARLLFPELHRRAKPGTDPTELLRNLATSNLELSPDLERKLSPAIRRAGFPTGYELYEAWVPRVARFSFDVGRAVQTVEPEPSGAGIGPSL